MCRVLILDDDLRFAESLKPVVEGFEGDGTITDIATTVDQALRYTQEAVLSGCPYTIFIIDQRLGTGMDGIEAMRELKAISPDSSAIMLTGINNNEVGSRAYQAGAFRYLAKPVEEEELVFVLKSLMQFRREDVENKWRKIFSEMMETALHLNEFDEVAKVITDYSIQLGFKRAHLFWAPKRYEAHPRDTFVGIECSGNECVAHFSEITFSLLDKRILSDLLRSRDVIFIHENKANNEFKVELETVGYQYPSGGLWILPLWSGEELLGALILDFGKTHSYLSTHQHTLLNFFTRQVSITLEHSGLYNREKLTSEEMKLLQRASVEMLRIANLNEEAFWLTVLTIATANFGLRFNRALLLIMKDNQSTLVGGAGVGDNNSENAIQGWKRDEERQYDLDSFIEDILAKRVQSTPLHAFIKDKEIAIEEFGSDIRASLENGYMIELLEEEAFAQLPASITAEFHPSACAALPIQAGNNVLGLVIVDNKHNRKPLSKKSLQNLQTLLANAGLVWETLRQRARSEDLLDANLETLGMASHQSLKKTLDRICKTAYLISQADWAIIHPFVGGKIPKQIEVKNLGYYGALRNSSIADLTYSKPRVGGVSRYVLRHGELIVKDINKCDPDIKKLQLPKHHFIQAEGVKALIGMAIMDPNSKDAIGILYLDYRKPRKFSDSDIHHTKSLASLAAVAISNAHEIEEVKQRRQFKLATEIAEAVGASLDLETTMDAILGKLHEAFEETGLCVLLYDKRLQALKFAPAALKYYTISNSKYVKQDTFHLEGGTIACRVAKKALANEKLVSENVGDVSKDADYLKLNSKTKSEFCVSLLNTKNKLLGVLALERDRINGFSSEDIELIKTVAQHISIAIERAQQKEDLEYNSTVAAQTSWAADIAHEINNEVGKILNWAYCIRMMAGDNLEIQEQAKNIEESVSHLSISNPLTNKPPEIVEIDAILKANLQQATIHRSIDVDFQFGAPKVKVLIKKAQLQHILKQLVNNAARAMKGLSEKKILVSTQLINNNTAIEILFRDFGPGISEDKHVSAFNRPFTTKETGGYGLLFIRQMIEDMQGDIMLLPYQEGRGAEFLIRVPVANMTFPSQSE